MLLTAVFALPFAIDRVSSYATDDGGQATTGTQTVDAQGVIASGSCGVNGDNLTWSFDDAGVLTILGAGAMKYCKRSIIDA
jgi:hypothetical protein